MVELNDDGIITRGGLSRLLFGADTLRFAEVRGAEARGRRLEVELIDGRQRRLTARSIEEAERVVCELDGRLHPARRLLCGTRSVRDLAAAVDAHREALPSALLELLILGAAQVRATDIHFERTGDELSLRVRVDGMIHEVATLPRDAAESLLGRLKVVAALISYRCDLTQEGRARIALEGAGAVSARVTTSPGVAGEQAVVRLHDPTKELVELEQLGFGPGRGLEQMAAAARLQRGVVVVAGPPSSGKSTTLFSLVRRLKREQGNSRRVVSIEDPVEVDLPGVAQAQVDTARGNTYPAMLRAALRQDADVLLVGEMRDRQTAEIVMQAGLCGHLVLTTVHAGSVAEALLRLLDLGIDRATLKSCLRVVLAQRLVRRLCRSCQGNGCEGCHGTGFSGRCAVGEAITLGSDDAAHRGMGLDLAKRSSAGELEAACVRDAGMIPLARAASEQVEEGVTSAAEVARVLG